MEENCKTELWDEKQNRVLFLGHRVYKMFSFADPSCCTNIFLQIFLYLEILGGKIQMVAINTVPVHQTAYRIVLLTSIWYQSISFWGP